VLNAGGSLKVLVSCMNAVFKLDAFRGFVGYLGLT
jgi:hypothetical protein